MTRTLPEHPPAHVGRYAVEEEIGRGGMGVVYRGRDPELDRPVALKALPRGGALDRDALDHLRREARLLAALNHAGIASIHDIVETADGPWLVLEFVTGESLDRVLARGPLSLDDALSVCRDVARAVEAAHARGIVHRDLKPSNVQIATDGTCKVLDFGLSRALANVSASGPRIPYVSGTPAYMSPEQMRGDDEDERTDVWAIGCLLYECLTARRPPPDMTALPADTPDGVHDVLTRCLQVNRAERAASMTLVREALEDARVRASAVPGNIPFETSSFLGRQRELDDLAARLAQARLLTLTGVGGTGKTRLALKLAERRASLFTHGAWLVDLGALSDPTLVVSMIAQSLGIREQAERSLHDALLARLAGQRLLLVLDNCEHLIVPVAHVAEEILRRAEGVCIVATSREALGVNGESVYLVGPLAEDDAVALFVERARAADSDFAPPDADLRGVRDICRQLDGLALSIELAAARTRVLSVEQIAERLRDRFALLTSGGRRAVARHKTLRAALDWSYELLTPEERIVLARLSVCAGGCTLAAAEDIVADDAVDRSAVLDLLGRLVDKSLLTVERSTPEVRYRLLESVREYAHERLAQDRTEAERAADRHLACYTRLAETAARAVHAPDQHEWFARLEEDHGNLRTAMDWAIAGAGDAQAALRLSVALLQFWNMCAYWTEGRRYIDGVLSLARPAPPSGLTMRVMLGAARLAQQQGDYADACRHIDRALALAVETGDRNSTANALNMLGTIAQHQGDYARAEDLIGRALAIKREVGPPHAIPPVLGNLGVLAQARGDAETALRHHEECYRMAEQLGDTAEMARALSNQGVVYFARGDFANARVHWENGLAIRRLLRDPAGTSANLMNLALIALAQGDLAGARAHMVESRALAQEVGYRWGVGATLVNTGHIDLAEGNTSAAAEHYRHALTLFRETRDVLPMVECVESLGRLAIETSDAPHGVALIAAGGAERRRLGAGSEAYLRSRLDTALARARDRLSGEAFADAWTGGDALSLDDAVALALRVTADG